MCMLKSKLNAMVLGRITNMETTRGFIEGKYNCCHLEDLKGTKTLDQIIETQVTVEVPNNCNCVGPIGSMGRVSDS